MPHGEGDLAGCASTQPEALLELRRFQPRRRIVMRGWKVVTFFHAHRARIVHRVLEVARCEVDLPENFCMEDQPPAAADLNSVGPGAGVEADQVVPRLGLWGGGAVAAGAECAQHEDSEENTNVNEQAAQHVGLLTSEVCQRGRYFYSIALIVQKVKTKKPRVIVTF
jgi:hypothetical protein